MQSNTQIRILIPVMLVMLMPLRTLAWWDAGHMVTAMIAYENLNKPAKKQVDGLIKVLNDEYDYTNHFVAAATWPDDLKAEGVRFYNTWHYTNIPYNPDGVALPPQPEVDVIWAIETCHKMLRDRRARDSEKARALAFLIHFVGDIHQPLHSTTMYSNEKPGGDRGGNGYDLEDPGHSNLHKLWDDGCGFTSELNDINPYGEPKAALTKEHLERLEKFAKKVMKNMPKKEFPFLSQTDPKYWAMESHDLAVKYAYHGYNGRKDNRAQFLSPGSTPGKDYLSNAWRVVEQRLATGGYRLAQLLNEIWPENE